MSSETRSSHSSSRRRPSNPTRQKSSGRPARPKGPVYDLYAAYPCETQNDVRRIVGNHSSPYQELEWPHIRVSLLTASVISEVREYARSGHPRHGGGYKSLVHSRRGDNTYTREVIRSGLDRLAALGIYPPEIDLAALPDYTALIQFRFTLLRPYRSADDELFYVHESPLQKESVFKVPMIRPTTWKGLLRSAIEQELGEDGAASISRLFGTATDEGLAEENQQGRLRFYPTFFDRIDLMVINPHSRVTKAGTVPILTEVAPPSARGTFTLLYLPFDLINLPLESVEREVSEDLQMVGQAIVALMRIYGFSAKRTRGFGLARRNVGGPGENDSGVVMVKGQGTGVFRNFARLSDAIETALRLIP